MAGQPIPPPSEEFTRGPFAFFPAILNIDHNEWTYVQSTWSEIQVRNTKSQDELWISRSYLGDLSRVEEPVMIVGLNRELAYRLGQVMPHNQKVLTMPRSAASAGEPAVVPPEPARGLAASSNEAQIGRLLLVVAGLVVVVALGALVWLNRDRTGESLSFQAVMQQDLNLGPRDEYSDIVRKMGEPNADQWSADEGALQYRRLTYQDRGLVLVLMGGDRDKARYFGALDLKGRPVHSVRLPDGNDSSSLLRSLGKRF